MAQIEKSTGKKVFYVDAVLGSGAQLAGVFAVLTLGGTLAEKLYSTEVPQADVFILGIPRFGLYGETSNPLISLAAVCAPPRMGINKPILRERGVVIALTRCTGHIDDNAHASYREVLNLFSGCHSSYELQEYEEEFLYREDLIFKYRHRYSYAPIHLFCLLYESQYILDWTSKVIFAEVASRENPLAPPQTEGTGARRSGGSTKYRLYPSTQF